MWCAEADRLPHARPLPCQRHGERSPVPSSAQHLWFGVTAAWNRCLPKELANLRHPQGDNEQVYLGCSKPGPELLSENLSRISHILFIQLQSNIMDNSKTGS